MELHRHRASTAANASRALASDGRVGFVAVPTAAAAVASVAVTVFWVEHMQLQTHLTWFSRIDFHLHKQNLEQYPHAILPAYYNILLTTIVTFRKNLLNSNGCTVAV